MKSYDYLKSLTFIYTILQTHGIYIRTHGHYLSYTFLISISKTHDNYSPYYDYL